MSSKRIRIFAGPNGSGKSTIIESIRKAKIQNKSIDFGIYINADDIARELRKNSRISLIKFGTKINKRKLVQITLTSGLLDGSLSEEKFKKLFVISDNSFVLNNQNFVEEIAQIVANFMREIALEQNLKFSFETVFSHKGKIDFMRRACDRGYKVYLYFVATEDPKINIFRIQNRVQLGGHNVPDEKVINRYFRSLKLLPEATKYCYKAFFFDNSDENTENSFFAQLQQGSKSPSIDKLKEYPNWFNKYYIDSL